MKPQKVVIRPKNNGICIVVRIGTNLNIHEIIMNKLLLKLKKIYISCEISFFIKSRLGI